MTLHHLQLVNVATRSYAFTAGKTGTAWKSQRIRSRPNCLEWVSTSRSMLLPWIIFYCTNCQCSL